MIDAARLPIAVIGNGFSAAQRLTVVKQSGADNIITYASDPEDGVAAQAGESLIRRWPEHAEFTALGFRVVYLCDLPEEDTHRLLAWAHDAGALVNVHDRQDLCDFHMPAILRRGHLQVTVSTDGKVAGLSRLLRDYLRDCIFGPEWADRVEDLGQARAAWVEKKLPFAELKANVERFVADRQWLGGPPQT